MADLKKIINFMFGNNQQPFWHFIILEDQNGHFVASSRRVNKKRPGQKI